MCSLPIPNQVVATKPEDRFSSLGFQTLRTIAEYLPSKEMYTLFRQTGRELRTQLLNTEGERGIEIGILANVILRNMESWGYVGDTNQLLKEMNELSFDQLKIKILVESTKLPENINPNCSCLEMFCTKKDPDYSLNVRSIFQNGSSNVRRSENTPIEQAYALTMADPDDYWKIYELINLTRRPDIPINKALEIADEIADHKNTVYEWIAERTDISIDMAVDIADRISDRNSKESVFSKLLFREDLNGELLLHVCAQIKNGSKRDFACKNAREDKRNDIIEALLRTPGSISEKLESIRERRISIAIKKSNVERVRALLEYAPDYQNNRAHSDFFNGTDLEYAVKDSNVEIVKMLLEKRPNTHLHGAIKRAVKLENKKILQILLEKGKTSDRIFAFGFSVWSGHVSSALESAKPHLIAATGAAFLNALIRACRRAEV